MLFFSRNTQGCLNNQKIIKYNHDTNYQEEKLSLCVQMLRMHP